MTIGDRIKQLREAAGLSQEQAAARAGVTVSAWSRWERGEHAPLADKLPTLASVLGARIEAFFPQPQPEVNHAKTTLRKVPAD